MRTVTPPSLRRLGSAEPGDDRRRRRPLGGPIFEAPEAPGVTERDRIFRRGLVLADALAAALALVVGVSVIGDDALRPAAALFIPLAVLVSKAIGLYDRDELLLRKSTLDEVPALLEVATAFTLLVWLLSPLLLDGTVGRGQALGLWTLLVVTGVGARFAVRELACRTAPAERCLLVADQGVIHRLIGHLVEGPDLGVEIVGCIEIDDAYDLES